MAWPRWAFVLAVLITGRLALWVAMPRFLKVPSLSDYVPEDGSVLVASIESLVGCCQHCVEDSHCWSVYYQAQHGACLLQDDELQSSLTVWQEPGWEYWVLAEGCPVFRGYAYSEQTGLCFKLFFNHSLDWDEAQWTCWAEGGHLLVIDDQQKQDKVVEQINSSPETAFPPLDNDLAPRSRGYFLDLLYDGTQGFWYWASTGRRFNDSDMAVWAQGQPDLSGGSRRRAAAIRPSSGQLWEAVRQHVRHNFICQIDV